MRLFALNLILALVWMFLTGSFSILSLFAGLVFGFFIIWAESLVWGSRRYPRAVVGILRLIVVFLWELVVANLQLARDILRVRPQLKPGLVGFDTRNLTPAQTVLLGHLISLTPGTVTLDTDADTSQLFIHSIYAHDPERLRAGFRLFATLIREAWGDEPASKGGEG